MPHVLRRYSKESSFWLVSEAYVHGVMDGEAMEESTTTEINPLF